MLMVIELQVKNLSILFFIIITLFSFVALDFYCKVVPKQWDGF
jgi:hypothetical protein